MAVRFLNFHIFFPILTRLLDSCALQPQAYAPGLVCAPTSAVDSISLFRAALTIHRVDKEVIVRLKWNEAEYKGRLVSVDLYMNIQLADTEETLRHSWTGHDTVRVFSLSGKI